MGIRELHRPRHAANAPSKIDQCAAADTMMSAHGSELLKT